MCLIGSVLACVCNIIAYFVRLVDRLFRECTVQNDLQKFLFRELFGGSPLQTGYPLYACQFRFHDDHIQRPADFHRQTGERLVIFISPVKISHPAHIAWGKACAVREIRPQKFCGHDRRTFLRTLADSLADGIHFIHLRKILRKNCGQFPIHRAVIHRFSDVHSFSFPR